MKRIVHYMIGSLAAVALLASCAKQEKQLPEERQEIKFSASVGNFQVKATDTAFDQGDEVSLWVEWPVDVNNVKLTWDSKGLIPEEPIYWGVGQDPYHVINFMAFSPYVTTIEGNPNEFIFAVQADQTSEEAFKASDLMSAYATVAPKDGNTVHLNFIHRMSKVVFTIDNRLEKEIVDVTVDGLHLDYRCWVYDGSDYWQALYDDRYSDNIGAIKAAQVTLADEAQTPAWAFITIPQWVDNPQFRVTTADGQVYFYNVPDGVFFESGRRYMATLVADESGSDIAFTAEVFDWIDGGDLYFGKSYDPGVQEHNWSVYFNDKYYPMEDLGEGIFHLSFTAFKNGWSFNICRNYGDMWLGSVIPSYYPYLSEGEELEIPLGAQSYVVVNTADDLYLDLLFNEVTKTLKVTPVPHQWESLGTGIFIDDALSSLLGYPHVEIPVEVQVDACCLGRYKIVNPYENWPYLSDFDNYSPTDIIINIDENNRCWIPWRRLGPIHNQYGDLYWNLHIPENGWDEGTEYGQFYPDYGYIRFNKPMTLFSMATFTEYQVNNSGMFSLTLPGYERPVHYLLDPVYNAGTQVEDGVTYARFMYRAGMDTKTLKWKLFTGTPSDAELQILMEEVKTSGTPLEDVVLEQWNILSVPVEHTGSYTILMYSDNNAGYYTWYYRYVSVVVEGEDVPEPELSVKAAPDEYFPDQKVFAHVQFANPETLYVMLMEQAAFERAGLTDDAIYDYVTSNGIWINATQIGNEGASYPFENLQPGTEYRLMVAGTTLFGQTAWDSVVFTTAETPEFEYVGTGTFMEYYAFSFTSQVEVQRAVNIPSRYRLLDPFKEYWGDTQPYDWYSGTSADYVDFAIDSDHIYYLPFETGYVNPNYGPLYYDMYSPGADITVGNNRVQDGVYSLAPFGRLYGTSSWYPVYSIENSVLIVMPGYTYTPVSVQSVTRRDIHRDIRELPVQHEK